MLKHQLHIIVSLTSHLSLFGDFYPDVSTAVLEVWVYIEPNASEHWMGLAQEGVECSSFMKFSAATSSSMRPALSRASAPLA